MFYRDGFQLLTNVITNSIPDAAGVLDPPQILIQKKLISYISRQLKVDDRVPVFVIFVGRFLLQVFHIYYINDTHREKLCFTQFSTRMAA